MSNVYEQIRDLQRIKNKEYDKQFDDVNSKINEVEEKLDSKLNLILNAIGNIKQVKETIIKVEESNEYKKDKRKKRKSKDKLPTFIPKVDLTGMSIKSKQTEDKKIVKKIDFSSSFDALDQFIKDDK